MSSSPSRAATHLVREQSEVTREVASALYPFLTYQLLPKKLEPMLQVPHSYDVM